MGYTLVISEKPDAARRIAFALGDSVKVKKSDGVPYFEIEEGKIVVVPAIGHLFTVKNRTPVRDYPYFDIEWVPTYTVKSNRRTKSFHKVIKNLAKNAENFVCATDYDIEGAVIGYTILKYLCGEDAIKKAERMKFSTLTKWELKESWNNRMKKLDFGQIYAGLTRHELDWLWGINVSRALSSAVEKVDKFIKLSAGRVQTPTLAMVNKRENEIESFIPEKFYRIFAEFEKNGNKYNMEYKSILKSLDDAKKIKYDATREYGNVKKVEIKNLKILPPVPFNLTELQREAYRYLGFSPSKTQRIAQTLYTRGLISYPRTSSEKLPKSVNYGKILESLSEGGYSELVKHANPKKKPLEGKKVDPAHPCIYPTGEIGDIHGDEKKVYELIVRRFISLFSDPAIRKIGKIEIDVGGCIFKFKSSMTIKYGWLNIYPYRKLKESEIPDIKQGEKVKISKMPYIKEDETKPPPRYTPASLITEMEKRKLGTKATRADIVNILYERGYITGRQIEITEIGKKVVETLDDYCPELISEELTRYFEEEMERIEKGEKEKDVVIAEAKNKLVEILEKFRQYEEKIGKKLLNAYRTSMERKRIVGKCPSCGGNLIVVVSKKSKKRFIGCSNYEKGCRISYPLPQKGRVYTTTKVCERCGAPMIRISTRRGSVLLCPNPECTKD